MLTSAGCLERRARLWALLPERADTLVLSEPRHLMYFANFHAPPLIYRTQNAAALLILDRDGTATLITDNMLASYAEVAHVDHRITAEWYTGRASAPERQGVLVEAGRRALAERSGARVAFDQLAPAGLCATLGDGRAMGTLGINVAAAALMRRKDPDEIALLRRIVRAMEEGFARGRRDIHAGMTELQAYSLVSAAVIDALGEQALVYGDFASGPRAEAKGGTPTPRVIEAGELFILDYSAVLYGYRADFTNTWTIDGQPTARQRELAALCVEAMEAGERMLRPETVGRQVHAALTSVFAAAGVADAFPHHSGHGIGLGHPDPPYLTPESDDTLAEGDVVTLEPGLYIPGEGGMRFERNYLITAGGFELLTQHHVGLV